MGASSNGLATSSRADCGSCPAELALCEVKEERTDRQRFDEQMTVNVDRLGDNVTALSLTVERVAAVASQLQGTCVSLSLRVDQLTAEVASMRNVKYWLGAIVAGIELARTQGFGSLLHSLGGLFQ